MGEIFRNRHYPKFKKKSLKVGIRGKVHFLNYILTNLYNQHKLPL